MKMGRSARTPVLLKHGAQARSWTFWQLSMDKSSCVGLFGWATYVARINRL